MKKPRKKFKYNIRMAKAIEAVEAMQTQSVKTGRDKITLEEINREIEAVRKMR